MDDKPLLVGLTVAAGLLSYKLYRDKREGELSLPPSPRSYPLIGHLLSVPTEFDHLGFMQLGKEIGSKIFSLSVFGTTIIVLNDRDDAVNLFDKRSSIYSDRTCSTMVQDSSLLNWGEIVSVIGYGDQWRRYRRLMNPWLTKKAVAAHQESQERATGKLLKRLLEGHKDIGSSHEVEAEFVLSVSEILFRSIYGYEVHSSKDPLASRTGKIFSFFTYALLPSNYLVNTLPILRYVPEWFPGAGWKREVLKWRREKESLVNEIYNIGRENMEKDKNTRIMAASFRSEALKLGLTEEEADEDVKVVAITFLGGGIETTVNVLSMFLLAMVQYPEAQKKAQKELDAVVGEDRLPNFEDRDQLGCIERIIQELLRWHPVTPIAVPHTCFQDDTYKGYRIPKGAIVTGNVWAMTRDESVYTNPEIFNPDRYLDPSTPPSPLFGWGRRRCPGSHIAQSSLFITIASILMTFDIGVAQDKDGKDVPPSGKLVNSIALTPENFMLKLTPRSTKHEELIKQSL